MLVGHSEREMVERRTVRLEEISRCSIESFILPWESTGVVALCPQSRLMRMHLESMPWQELCLHSRCQLGPLHQK